MDEVRLVRAIKLGMLAAVMGVACQAEAPPVVGAPIEAPMTVVAAPSASAHDARPVLASPSPTPTDAALAVATSAPSSAASSKRPRSAQRRPTPKSCCAGKNDCKGQSGCAINASCAGAGNCAGKNACKGTGTACPPPGLMP